MSISHQIQGILSHKFEKKHNLFDPAFETSEDFQHLFEYFLKPSAHSSFLVSEKYVLCIFRTNKMIFEEKVKLFLCFLWNRQRKTSMSKTQYFGLLYLFFSVFCCVKIQIKYEKMVRNRQSIKNFFPVWKSKWLSCHFDGKNV